MKFSNDFLEYLRFSVADTITYEHSCDKHDGEFTVLSKIDTNDNGIVKFKKDKLKISNKFRKSITMNNIFKKIKNSNALIKEGKSPVGEKQGILNDYK